MKRDDGRLLGSFGVLSNQQLRIAREKLAEGWGLRRVGRLLGATASELDLSLWSEFGGPTTAATPLLRLVPPDDGE